MNRCCSKDGWGNPSVWSWNLEEAWGTAGRKVCHASGGQVTLRKATLCFRLQQGISAALKRANWSCDSIPTAVSGYMFHNCLYSRVIYSIQVSFKHFRTIWYDEKLPRNILLYGCSGYSQWQNSWSSHTAVGEEIYSRMCHGNVEFQIFSKRLHLFSYLIDGFSSARTPWGRRRKLELQRKTAWKEVCIWIEINLVFI